MRFFRLSFFCSVFLSGALLKAADPTPQQKMLERMMNPDRSQKSAYQGRAFDPGNGFFGKKFQTEEYAGIKKFESKSFATQVFEGAKKSWVGSLLFHQKKLPENLQGADRDAGKTFSSKSLEPSTYSGADKTSALAGKEDFSTRQITSRGTTQGAIDADQQLQEKVKKGLSIDEVRKLLNKAP